MTRDHLALGLGLGAGLVSLVIGRKVMRLGWVAALGQAAGFARVTYDLVQQKPKSLPRSYADQPRLHGSLTPVTVTPDVEPKGAKPASPTEKP